MPVIGTERVRIARAESVVRAQFFDVAHHCDNNVHSGPRWQLLKDVDGIKTVKIGPQVGEIFWEGEVLWLVLVRGPGAGSRIAHRFATIGAETEVIATFSIPLPKPLTFLAPLVRWFVARQLRRGLREDAMDLRTYGR